MKKECSKCRRMLPVEQFTRNKSKKDGYNSYCRLCNSNYQKDYEIDRNKYKGRYKQTQKECIINLRQRKKALIENSKRKPCADCHKEYPPCVMDFDHIKGKKE